MILPTLTAVPPSLAYLPSFCLASLQHLFSVVANGYSYRLPIVFYACLLFKPCLYPCVLCLLVTGMAACLVA